MAEDIPLFRISWDGDDVKNVVDSVTRGSHWANGPYVEDFERRIEEYVGVEHAVVFNSGTTALVGALDAHEIGPGDEVIVPSFTFIGTANAVRLVGARPVFADIEPERYGLDPEAVRARITQDTEAVIPVHYAGAPCRINELREVAIDNDLVLIEDAAEAFGAEHKGGKVGLFGDSAMFSFCQNKVITTGEGGAVVTDNGDLAKRLRLGRSHGRASSGYFDSAEGGDYVRLGSNYRMADIVAALGVAQMEKVEELINKRRTIAERMSAGIDDISRVSPPGDPPDGRHVYQLYTVTLDETVDRNGVIDSLADEGIASKVYFDPVHRSQYYQTSYDGSVNGLTTTEEISSRVLSLPMYPEPENVEIARIVESLRRSVAENSN